MYRIANTKYKTINTKYKNMPPNSTQGPGSGMPTGKTMWVAPR